MTEAAKDERLQVGTSFPSMSFRSELEGESPITRKELDQFYGWLEGFLRAAGFNANGTFNNLVTNSLTVVNNYGIPIPPTAIVPGRVLVVGADGSVSSCCGGGGCICIPAGSLAFDGYGHAPFEFYTPGGVRLDPPSTLPTAPGEPSAGMVALANGRVAFTGADSAITSFVMDSQLTTVIGSSPDPTLSNSGGIQTNFGAHFYTYLKKSPNYELQKINADGVTVAVFDMGFSEAVSFGPLAVAPDESFGYYIKRNTNSAPVKQFDLAGGVTNLITKVNHDVSFGPMMCLPDGTLLIGWHSTTGGPGLVERYDNTGTLLETLFVLPNRARPLVITPGLSPARTFWLSALAGATTDSGVTVYEIDIATHEVLNQFDPESGSFDFAAPFCVLRQGIATAA